MHPILQLTVLAMAVAAVSMTVSKAKVFKGIRSWLRSAWPWLGELVSCPYCTSHWVAAAAVALWQPRPLTSGWLLADLTVSVFAVVMLAAVFSGLIFRSLSVIPSES